MRWRTFSLFLSVVIVFGIVVLLNILSFRFHKRVDFTKEKLHTLSQQTMKVLSSLDSKIDITAFYKSSDDRREALRELMDEYMSRSKLISFRFVDPDKEPLVAKSYKVNSYGTIVFECGKRRISINPFDVPTEEDITNAIIRVTRERKKKIVFIEGHGEHDTGDTSPSGYYQINRELENKGYNVESLSLAEIGRLPKDVAVVIVAGPQKDLFKGELRILFSFWKKGGGLMFMMDPGFPEETADFIKNRWGVVFHKDLVVDPVSKLFGGNIFTPVVSDYMNNPITGNFKYATFFPISCSLSVSPREGMSYHGLLKTNKESWGETNLKGNTVKLDKNDFKGPLVLGYLVEGEKKYKGKAVFLGDSDFPSNSFINASGNKDLFLSLVSYLAQEKELVSITPKREENTPLYLTRTQSWVLFIVSVVFIPVLFGLAGLLIFLKRRRL